MTRRVRGLKHAEWIDAPKFKASKRSAAQERGLAYERRVGKYLKFTYDDEADILLGPWISFKDNWGSSICQPDAIIVPRDPSKPAIVVEVKLSHVKGAKGKLRQLYCKLVEHILKRKTASVQIYRNKEGKDKQVEFTRLLDMGPGEYRECPWL